MDVAELVDRALITETLHAYCALVDSRDIEALLDLFTGDAVIDLGHGAVFAGTSELRRVLIDRIGRWTTTNHHCSTTTLRRYDGAAAAATSYIYAFHDSPERNRTMHLWGRYEDDLARIEGRWLIRERRLLVAGVREENSQAVPQRFQLYSRKPLPQI
jgi:ketosteroid isomerase-like protein